MARFINLFFLLFIFTALFTGCDEWGKGLGDDFTEESVVLPDIKPFQKGETVSRTLLVYLVAENSISNDLTADFNEIKAAAYNLPNDVRLFVYFDNSNAELLPTLYQYHPHDGDLFENVVYTFEEDVCSSDIAVMGQVLDLVLVDYPTEAFDMVMGSHADGWIRYNQKSAQNRTIGIDNGRNTYSNNITKTIEIEELAVLLERLPVKVDRLMFDACLMQGVEVAYALRNSANWIIASPAEIPAYGAPYDKVVPLFFNQDSGVEDIMYEYKKSYDNEYYGVVLSNEYYGVVLSAICTSYMQELATSTRACVEKYFNVDSSNKYTGSIAYVPGKAPAYYDINSVMKRTLDAADYECWKSVFNKAVPYIMVSNSKKVWSGIAYSIVSVGDDAGAVSAYFPQNKSLNSSFNNDFRTTEWYSAAGWDVAGW